MKILTLNEQKAVSGGGDYFDKLSVVGAEIGGVIISPLALLMATTASDNPNGPITTGLLAFLMITGIGASIGAVVGGAVGLTLDYFSESARDENIGRN